MPRGSRQAGTSRAPPLLREPVQEASLPEIPRPSLEPTPQVAAEQLRLLEMEETIRMLVRRNQDMERQFRSEIETLKQQQLMQPMENRHALTPAPPTGPIQQDDQASSSSIHNRREASRPPTNDDNQPRPRPDGEPNQA